MSIPIHDQIKCVEREIALRRSVYARRVSSGSMTQEAADREIATMEAVLDTLRTVKKMAFDPEAYGCRS
ncbi:MAG: hypothetical protein K1X67_07910 [Fimbriimonadaceae bacterium]|nr:hypothetical protein [Fimbriimonadaceae bacterium]